MAHDVFVSYSSKDKTIADTIVAAMENNHIRCWVAPRDVKPGEDWANAITNAIQDSKVFLVIFSGNSNKSQRVLDEINFAISQELTILPFRIENLEPDGALRLHLSSRHWLDAYDPSWEKHLIKLTSTIASILEKPAGEIGTEISGTKGKKRRSRTWVRVLVGLVVTTLLAAAAWFGWPALKKQSPANPAPTGTRFTGISTRTTTTEIPTPTPGVLPVALKVFSDPILAAVQPRTPDFEDDFSQVKPGWEPRLNDPITNTWDCSEAAQLEIKNGSMQVLGKEDCSIIQLFRHDAAYANFLLQVDVDFQEKDTNFSIIWNRIKDRMAAGMSEFQINRNGWNLNTTRTQGIWIELITGNIFLDASKPVTLTLIYKDNISIIYLDDIPLVYTFDQSDLPASAPEITLLFQFVFGPPFSSSPQMIELDNVKVWDLDKIDGLPVVALNAENGHRYFYTEENKTWQLSRDYCKSLGGYLAAIETAAENSFVYQLTGGKTWIGATDEVKEGYWAWDNGQPFDYHNFAEGEPDHNGASYVSYSENIDTGEVLETWQDGPSDIEMPFVCELDPAVQE
jgi:hypothetical protein